MAHLAYANDLPSILDLSSCEPKSRCIGITRKQLRCRNSVKINPSSARDLREDIALARKTTDSSAAGLRSLVVEASFQLYACWQHKKDLYAATDMGQSLRRYWREQLRTTTQTRATCDNVIASTNGIEHTSPTRASQERVACPRYDLRSAGQHTHSVDNDTDPAPQPHFVPMKRPRHTLTQKLHRGPSSKEQKIVRSLYAYTRASDPNMTKIGVSKDVNERMSAWRRKCGYEPDLRHHFADVPCAKFVEGLVHYELLPYWRREVRCRHNAQCATQHQEWFDLHHASAAKVMDNWVEWITVAEPYDQSYQLRPKWRAVIATMEKSEIPVTSRGLLDAMGKIKVDTKSTTSSGPGAVSSTTVMAARAKSSPEISNTLGQAPAPLPGLDALDAANIISTIADMILSLPSPHACELRGLLDQRMPAGALAAVV